MADEHLCKIEGCAKTIVNGRGWCTAHYKRWQRHGDPLGGRTMRGEPIKWIRSHANHEDKVACLLWPYADAAGRPSINIGGKTRIASRLMCALAHGAPPDNSAQAAHSCGRGDEGCMNPHHLRWATASENEADKLIHGTSNRGERHGLAKLTEDQVRQIRGMRGTMSQRKAAASLGLSRGIVESI